MRALILALLLAGCSQTITSGCPPVADYPAWFQTKALAELAPMPADSAIRRMMDDYKRMRDQARACR